MSQGYQVKSTKEIKAALQRIFNHPFSVRQDRGTASHWVRIGWTNGPSDKQVRAVCHSFNDTKNDDLQTDLWCGSQYTNEHREYVDPYCWQLAGNLDLREKPSLRDQLYNYFDYLSHGGHNVSISMDDDGTMAEIRSSRPLTYEGIPDVSRCLCLQGYACALLEEDRVFQIRELGLGDPREKKGGKNHD